MIYAFFRGLLFHHSHFVSRSLVWRRMYAMQSHCVERFHFFFLFSRAISILSSIESTWVNLHSTVASANTVNARRSFWLTNLLSGSIRFSILLFIVRSLFTHSVLIFMCYSYQTHAYTESSMQHGSVCRQCRDWTHFSCYAHLFFFLLRSSLCVAFIVVISVGSCCFCWCRRRRRCFFFNSCSHFSRRRSLTSCCFVLNVILSCPAWHISDYFCLSKWIFMNGVVLSNTKHKKSIFILFFPPVIFSPFLHRFHQYDVCYITMWTVFP